MNNGTTEKVIEHFNKVAMLPDTWDHNQQYQKYMLKYIKNECQLGLDLGCGTGELTSKLSLKCKEVIGLDIAPKMIKEAKLRNSKKNIKYLNTDVDSYLENFENHFDVIVSIAALHHMDCIGVLNKCKGALKKDGVLIIQDLYHENTLIFKFLSLIGLLTNPLYMLVNIGRLRVAKEHADVWKGHREDDNYNSFKEIKEMAEAVFPDFKIKRHLFWRYSLICYKK